MRRSRGDRSLTTSPPIRISPEVGTSSPAIMRSRVVFPEPDGPRKTRNSPSSVTRSTSFTAPSVPALKTLVTARVSTMAMVGFFGLLPAGEDSFVLGLHRLCGVLRRLVAARTLGEERRHHERAERLVDAGAGVPRIADVGRPRQHIAQHVVLVGWIDRRILGDRLLEIGHGLLEAREVVEP